MCGIAGIIHKGRSMEVCEAQMADMLEAQRHRGPDHSGFQKFGKHVLLGHNRLSIIDLSDQANQPMISNDERLALVFNGEIYNYLELREQLQQRYVFKTQSDTEVLIAAYKEWGTDAFDRLIGMFAFAIFDQANQEVLLVRDRFGVKPLYYSWDEMGKLYFASEIKTLHAAGIPRVPNQGLWASYLAKGIYQYRNETFWDGIYQLEAGHFAKINLRSSKPLVSPKRWYHFIQNIQSLRNCETYLGRDETAHRQKYQQLLEHSIRLRFRSDVPVGINISGGLDSSTLLGSVHRIFSQDQVEAFTFYCMDDRYDEIPWAQKLIAETNKPLSQVLLNKEEVPNLAQRVALFQDEPYGGIPTLAYSKIFETARDKGILVLLDGQGMDEAWAGYDYYHKSSDSVVQGVKSSPLRPEVLNPEFLKLSVFESYPNPFQDKLLNKQYRDLFYTKIPRALRFNDRISMMYSTELREPFLDHRLVEYAFALPQSMKINNGQVKWVLRQLSSTYLRGDLVFAPKRPLQTPQREWLTEDLSNWVGDTLSGIRDNSWFKQDALNKSWQKLISSKVDNTFFLWQWLSVAWC